MKPFIGSSKSADIIFVWWGKRLVTPFKIYMMIHQTISVWWHVIVILVSSRLEDDYTPAQWVKYIYNHEANLGDEDCTVIFGLADFCNMVTVTTGKQVSLCTLRKNTPTVPGMIRPKVIALLTKTAPSSHSTIRIGHILNLRNSYLESSSCWTNVCQLSWRESVHGSSTQEKCKGSIGSWSISWTYCSR